MDPEKQTFSTNCSFFHSKIIWRGIVQLFDQTFFLTSLQPITGQEPGLDCFEANQRETPVGFLWVSVALNTLLSAQVQKIKCKFISIFKWVRFHSIILKTRSSTKPCVVLVKVPVTVVDVVVEQLPCPEQWWWWWWWLGGRGWWGWWGELPREALQRGFPHKSDCGSLALLVVAPFNRCANLTTVKTFFSSYLAWEEVLIYDRPEEIKNWSVMAANTWSG